MKMPLALAGAVLLGSTLVACGGGGGGEDSDYCKDVKKASKTFTDLSAGDVGELDRAFATFHKLADEAPGAIKSDWKTLDDALKTIQNALSDAGLKFSDLDKIQAGQVPANLDPSKLAALAPKLSKLNDANFSKASKAITDHAKNTCKVTLQP